MTELLIKIGDNYPHKDYQLDQNTTDAVAKQEWIEREAAIRTYWDHLEYDGKIQAATAKWLQKCSGGYRHGDIVAIRPDGFEWGARESFPRFYIVRVADSLLAANSLSPDDLIKRYLLPEAERLKSRIDSLDGKQYNWIEPTYYHRREFYLPGIESIAKPDSIAELKSLSGLIKRASGYEQYNPGLAVAHSSAGTYTIKSSGGDYTSFTNWESGENSDLVTESAGHSIGVLYASASPASEDLDINGWTTDADNHVVMSGDGDDPHDGIEGTGVVWSATANTYILDNYEDYLTIKWLEITGPSMSAKPFCYNRGAYYVTYENCLLYDLGAGNWQNTGNMKFKNCIIYSINNAGEYLYIAGSFYNCSIYGDDNWGFSNNDILIRDAACYNVVAINTSSHVTYGTFYNCSGDYNCGDDTSAPGANSLDNKSAVDVAFVSVSGGSEDLHIGSGSDLIDAGKGSATYSEVLNTDIDGDTRPTGDCDIGADEYVAGGVSVNCTQSDITIASKNPTVSVQTPTAVSCTQGDVSISANNASLNVATQISCTQRNITISAKNPTVGLGVNISAGQRDISISSKNASISVGTVFTATQANISINAKNASVAIGTGISCTSSDITIAAKGAAVKVDTGIQCGSADITVSAKNAEILLGTQITASQANVTIAAKNASISAATAIECSQADLTISAKNVSLNVATQISASQRNIGISSKAATVKTDYLIEPTTGFIIITGHNPSVTYSAAVLVTPGDRTYVVAAEDRTYTIESENRVYIVPAETRIYSIA